MYCSGRSQTRTKRKTKAMTKKKALTRRAETAVRSSDNRSVNGEGTRTDLQCPHNWISGNPHRNSGASTQALSDREGHDKTVSMAGRGGDNHNACRHGNGERRFGQGSARNQHSGAIESLALAFAAETNARLSITTRNLTRTIKGE